MPLLFIIIEQDTGQRCFAGTSAKVVSRAAFWAGIILMMICIIPVYFGTLANVINLDYSLYSGIISANGPSIERQRKRSARKYLQIKKDIALGRYIPFRREWYDLYK